MISVGDVRPSARAEEDLAELGADVAVGDRAFAQRGEVVARLVHRRFAAIDEEARRRDRVAVELARRGDAGADGVDVHAVVEPVRAG